MHEELVAPAFAAVEALHRVDAAPLAMAFEIKDRAYRRTAACSCSAGGTTAAAMLRHLPRLMHAIATAIERHGPSPALLALEPRRGAQRMCGGPVALDGVSDGVHEARQMAQHRRRHRPPRGAHSRPADGAVLDLKRHRQRRVVYEVECLRRGEGGGDELLVHRPLRPRRPLPVS